MPQKGNRRALLFIALGGLVLAVGIYSVVEYFGEEATENRLIAAVAIRLETDPALTNEFGEKLEIITIARWPQPCRFFQGQRDYNTPFVVRDREGDYSLIWVSWRRKWGGSQASDILLFSYSKDGLDSKVSFDTTSDPLSKAESE